MPFLPSIAIMYLNISSIYVHGAFQGYSHGDERRFRRIRVHKFPGLQPPVVRALAYPGITKHDELVLGTAHFGSRYKMNIAAEAERSRASQLVMEG